MCQRGDFLIRSKFHWPKTSQIPKLRDVAFCTPVQAPEFASRGYVKIPQNPSNFEAPGCCILHACASSGICIARIRKNSTESVQFRSSELLHSARLCKLRVLHDECIPRDVTIKRASSTPRASQAVTHPSTNRALQWLTSEFGRDPVYSLRYGR